MLIYLATPVDQATPDAHAARDELLRQLSGQTWTDCSVYDPSGAFIVRGASGAAPAQVRGLNSINDEAFARSELVVALFVAGVASVGVPFEAGRALQLPDKKLLLVGTDASARDSWILADWDLQLRTQHRGGLVMLSEFAQARALLRVPEAM